MGRHDGINTNTPPVYTAAGPFSGTTAMSGGSVYLNQANPIDLGPGPWSLQLWVQWPSATAASLKIAIGNGNQPQIQTNSSGFFGVVGPWSLSSTVVVTDGSWHFVEFCSDTTHVYCLVDGTLSNTLTLANATLVFSNHPLNPVTIGNFGIGGSFQWPGALSDVAFSQVCLHTATYTGIPTAPLADSDTYKIAMFHLATNAVDTASAGAAVAATSATLSCSPGAIQPGGSVQVTASLVPPGMVCASNVTLTLTHSLGGTNASGATSIVIPAGSTQATATRVTDSSAVQTITITGAPTGGTFPLTFAGQTTSGLAFNATTAVVQTALQGLSSIGSGNATVGGSAGNYVVTFAGTLAETAVAAITSSGASLTGGTSPGVTVSVTATDTITGVLSGGLIGGAITTSFGVIPATTPGASALFSPGILSVVAGTPASTTATISFATPPSNYFGSFSTILQYSFDGINWFPIPQTYPVLPFTYDQISPNTTMSFRAIVTEGGGRYAITPPQGITTGPAAASSRILVICCGDSTTAGDVGDPNCPTANLTGHNTNTNGTLSTGSTYPSQLAMLLGDGFDVINAGLNGQTMGISFGSNAFTAFYNSSIHTAVYFLFWYGINNLRGSGASASSLYGTLKTDIASLKALHTGAVVVVGTLGDAYDYAAIDGGNAATSESAMETLILTYNNLIRANWFTDAGAAAFADIAAIPYFAPGAANKAQTPEYYAQQIPATNVYKLHYTSKSAKLIAQSFFEALQQALYPPTGSSATGVYPAANQVLTGSGNFGPTDNITPTGVAGSGGGFHGIRSGGNL